MQFTYASLSLMVAIASAAALPATTAGVKATTTTGAGAKTTTTGIKGTQTSIASSTSSGVAPSDTPYAPYADKTSFTEYDTYSEKACSGSPSKVDNVGGTVNGTLGEVTERFTYLVSSGSKAFTINDGPPNVDWYAYAAGEAGTATESKGACLGKLLGKVTATDACIDASMGGSEVACVSGWYTDPEFAAEAGQGGSTVPTSVAKGGAAKTTTAAAGKTTTTGAGKKTTTTAAKPAKTS